MKALLDPELKQLKKSLIALAPTKELEISSKKTIEDIKKLSEKIRQEYNTSGICEKPTLLKYAENTCYMDSILMSLLQHPTKFIWNNILTKDLSQIKSECKNIQAIQHELQTLTASINSGFVQNICNVNNFQEEIKKNCNGDQAFGQKGQQDPQEFIKFLYKIFGITVEQYRLHETYTRQEADEQVENIVAYNTERRVLSIGVGYEMVESENPVQYTINIREKQRVDNWIQHKDKTSYKDVNKRYTLKDAQDWIIYARISSEIIGSDDIQFTPDEFIQIKNKNNENNENKFFKLTRIIINHGGHYTAYIKCGDIWFHYNDKINLFKNIGEFGNLITQQNVQKRSYLLMYIPSDDHQVPLPEEAELHKDKKKQILITMGFKKEDFEKYVDNLPIETILDKLLKDNKERTPPLKTKRTAKETLQDMGFEDKGKIDEALNKSNNNLKEAIGYLVDDQPKKEVEVEIQFQDHLKRLEKQLKEFDDIEGSKDVKLQLKTLRDKFDKGKGGEEDKSRIEKEFEEIKQKIANLKIKKDEKDTEDKKGDIEKDGPTAKAIPEAPELLGPIDFQSLPTAPSPPSDITPSIIPTKGWIKGEVVKYINLGPGARDKDALKLLKQQQAQEQQAKQQQAKQQIRKILKDEGYEPTEECVLDIFNWGNTTTFFDLADDKVRNALAKIKTKCKRIKPEIKVAPKVWKRTAANIISYFKTKNITETKKKTETKFHKLKKEQKQQFVIPDFGLASAIGGTITSTDLKLKTRIAPQPTSQLLEILEPLPKNIAFKESTITGDSSQFTRVYTFAEGLPIATVVLVISSDNTVKNIYLKVGRDLNDNRWVKLNQLSNNESDISIKNEIWFKNIGKFIIPNININV